MPERTAPAQNRDSIPVPDPTALTTQLVRREIDATKKQSKLSIKAIRTHFDTRLEAMDKATTLLQQRADKVPSDMDVQIGHLRGLHSEKFDSFSKQLEQRDKQVEQIARDNKVAIDAALQAQKEAVGKQNEASAASTAKSEALFTKQIEQQGALAKTSLDALRDMILDMKDRLSVIEGKGVGAGIVWGVVGAVLGLVIAAVGILIAVFRN